jgi:FAD/FMN-containing dehydrogenase
MSYATRNDIQSWGRVVRAPQRVASPRFRDDLPSLIASRPGQSVLPVGLRRSYGDSVLNSQGGLVAMTGIDRFIAIDFDAGRLRAEAGVTLDEIMRRVVPHGYFLPVTPGTRFITLGGAIANDVHGKNHHRVGTFGRHVLRVGLLRSDGSRLEIGPDSNNELFAATIGGLGLTGIIEWAEIGLQQIDATQLDVEIVPFRDLSEFWHLADTSNSTHEHTVAWFDCTGKGRRAGRGVSSRANWASERRLVAHVSRQRAGIPFEPPSWILNRFTVTSFNRLYFAVQSRRAATLRQHYTSFFHPLDAIANWNRLYGRRGFWQYQCVLPPPTMKDGIAALLREISYSGEGSFLAVLKTFGHLRSPGLLSFPEPGTTLSLDFPNRGERTLQLLSRLDAIVFAAKGRLYAAKDGRIPKAIWTASNSNLERFTAHIDPAFSSDFWRRVAY